MSPWASFTGVWVGWGVSVEVGTAVKVAVLTGTLVAVLDGATLLVLEGFGVDMGVRVAGRGVAVWVSPGVRVGVGVRLYSGNGTTVATIGLGVAVRVGVLVSRDTLVGVLLGVGEDVGVSGGACVAVFKVGVFV